MENDGYILGFDTANESITVAIAKNNDDNKIEIVCRKELAAHRQSNTLLLPSIQELIKLKEISPKEIKTVLVGRGPGSFTGVRIALATAKGIATALQIPLIGFNTLDSIAWRAWHAGTRGHIFVVADAMRHEIYPALYLSEENGITKLSHNKVLKAEKCTDEAIELEKKCENLTVTGDALHKYFDLFSDFKIANQELWNPLITEGLISVYLNKNKTSAGLVLPVYTRLSDAEESEREKLATNNEKNLHTGVQNLHTKEINFAPMAYAHIQEIKVIENNLMKSDAWNSNKLKDELKLNNRSWWVAKHKENIIAYAGAMLTDDKMDILKVAVLPKFQRQHIASKLLSYVANDIRDLGAKTSMLEVRISNTDAQKFYDKLNFKVIAKRNKYYSDGEDAIIMQGPLPIINNDVAGMNLQISINTNLKSDNMLNNEDVLESNNDRKDHHDNYKIHKNKNNKTYNKIKFEHPVIFSIETSCDETACAITCNGKVISDVVASQVDFHKRFGGVVPEIASRKHIEAICGVAEECIEKTNLNWKDIDAIAATYAPGLVGALVVGLAFAKGLSFALEVPLIGVNHLEGHIYANKLSNDNIEFPAIASIISGGNTMLVQIDKWGKYKTLGTTIDDAVGEAFDKISKYLGLGYPGGPIISKLSEKGNPSAIKFPRAMINTNDYQFSLSGLKTAVITYIEKNKNSEYFNLEDLCASFEQAIIDVQVSKARDAIKKTNAKSFLFGGGVAANKNIRDNYKKMCNEENVNMILAPLTACGDNAAMIGLVANDRFKNKKFFNLDCDVYAHAVLDQDY